MITEMDIAFRFVRSLGFDNGHIALFRDDVNKLTKEVVTPKDLEQFKKPNITYYIDDDEREFHNLEELIEAYNELYIDSQDNPAIEVKYVKVFKKRSK